MNARRWADVLLGAAALMALAVAAREGLESRRANTELRKTMETLGQERGRHGVLVARARLLRRVVSASRIRAGTQLHGRSGDGKDVSLDLGNLEKPVLLYTVDPDCRACMATLPVIGDLHRSSSCGVHVLGVYVGDPSKLQSIRHAVPFEVLADPSGIGMDLVPLGVTPATVLIDVGGRFGGLWIGALDGQRVSQVETALRDLC